MRLRRLVTCFLCFLLLAGVPGHAGDDSTVLQPHQDIVLGMSGAFTGASASLGEHLKAGMQAYFDTVNAQGGVHGRRIHLLTYDDAYDPASAMRNTLRLMEDRDVFALIGFVGTPTVSRAAPLLTMQTGELLYLFFPFTGSSIIREGHYAEHVFNLRASYRQETAAIVDYLVSHNARRLGIFYQADAYGRSGWDGVRRALASRGMALVGEATYRRGATYEEDYSTQVAMLRDEGADAIIIIASYAAAAGFIRDARRIGWEVPIANVSFASSNDIRDLLLGEDVPQSARLTENLLFTEVVPNVYTSSEPAVREYRELMSDLGLELSFVGFEGYLNARLMTAILEQLGPEFSREDIDDVVYSLRDFDIGLSEEVTFSKGDNQGLQRVYFNTLDNGNLVPLEDR